MDGWIIQLSHNLIYKTMMYVAWCYVQAPMPNVKSYDFSMTKYIHGHIYTSCSSFLAPVLQTLFNESRLALRYPAKSILLILILLTWIFTKTED